jgi:hypothetical protein
VFRADHWEREGQLGDPGNALQLCHAEVGEARRTNWRRENIESMLWFIMRLSIFSIKVTVHVKELGSDNLRGILSLKSQINPAA